MKKFFTTTFACVLGTLIAGMILILVGVFSLTGILAASASGDTTYTPQKNTVLKLTLSGALNERYSDDPLQGILSQGEASTGLDQIRRAIKVAAENDNVTGIFIDARGMAQMPASSEEIRRLLADFKEETGKWIYAYADNYTQSDYLIASVADRILLNPSGQVDWHGIASQPIFLKDLMAKFGVKMQLAKVGAYKSAPEMFTADKMSDANREQVTAYVNGLWQNVCKGVSESRKISIEQLNAYADSFITLNDAKDFVKYKFVDKLVYTDGIKAEINNMLKADATDDINTVSVADMKVVKGQEDKGEEIAVYYAYGDIVDNETASMMSDTHNIVGKKVCEDLEKLMEDDNVKAVVIRINSGGGSAYASEQIWHYVDMLKKKKPVVVSMGGMAASGGYYIASGANWIVAEPTTLTGSIGIFGMFPDMSELLTQKLGVKFDEVKTNRHSAFGTPARPFNAEEMNYLNKYIDRGYNLFRSRVAQGRKMSVNDVEKIAQGRVWLGQDALKIKLVDELGGLDRAVAKAAELAKLQEYHTSPYPGKSSWLDQLLNQASGGSYVNAQMRQALGEYYQPFMLLKTINSQSAIQARVPFMMNIN